MKSLFSQRFRWFTLNVVFTWEWRCPIKLLVKEKKFGGNLSLNDFLYLCGNLDYLGCVRHYPKVIFPFLDVTISTYELFVFPFSQMNFPWSSSFTQDTEMEWHFIVNYKIYHVSYCRTWIRFNKWLVLLNLWRDLWVPTFLVCINLFMNNIFQLILIRYKKLFDKMRNLKYEKLKLRQKQFKRK